MDSASLDDIGYIQKPLQLGASPRWRKLPIYGDYIDICTCFSEMPSGSEQVSSQLIVQLMSHFQYLLDSLFEALITAGSHPARYRC